MNYFATVKISPVKRGWRGGLGVEAASACVKRRTSCMPHSSHPSSPPPAPNRRPHQVLAQQPEVVEPDMWAVSHRSGVHLDHALLEVRWNAGAQWQAGAAAKAGGRQGSMGREVGAGLGICRQGAAPFAHSRLPPVLPTHLVLRGHLRRVVAAALREGQGAEASLRPAELCADCAADSGQKHACPATQLALRHSLATEQATNLKSSIICTVTLGFRYEMMTVSFFSATSSGSASPSEHGKGGETGCIGMARRTPEEAATSCCCHWCQLQPPNCRPAG